MALHSLLNFLEKKKKNCDWQWMQFLLETEKKIIAILSDLFCEKQLGKLKYRYHDVLSL